MDRLETATALLRGVHVAASLSLVGCLVFQQWVMPAPERAWHAAVTLIGCISGGLAILFGAGWLAAVSGTMAGASNLETTLAAVPMVARHSGFGNLVCLRLILLAVTLLLLTGQHPFARVAALIAAGAGLALQPFLGHIGALPDANRSVLIPVEIAHLLAAGSWFGGLIPLLVCTLRAPPKLASVLCERFTPVGLIAVGTLAITALPQAGELIGGLPGLFGTPYGRLALIKLGLFACALSLACVNRLVLTARLATARRDSARSGLVVSVAIEVAVVLCVVLAAAAMASSPPAAHVQPVWPFSWRPGLQALENGEVRAALLRLAIAAGLGVLVIGSSLALRRFRIAAACVAVILIAPFTPALARLLVEAYPTSYARSATGFSAAAVARGQMLFGQHCAVCHEPQNGTGEEADLTAAHIWGHLDGELFWWVTNGVLDPRGAALMPGFGAALSEDDRWALIDFIHARNVGAQVSKTGQWSPPVAAPATPLLCQGRDADSLADLAGHGLLLVAEPGDTTDVRLAVADIVTIRLGKGATQAPGDGDCVAALASAWNAWAVLAGVAPDAFAGYRAVVDGQGWLRAWLPPGTRAERIKAVVGKALAHPIAIGAQPAVGHQH